MSNKRTKWESIADQSEGEAKRMRKGDDPFERRRVELEPYMVIDNVDTLRQAWIHLKYKETPVQALSAAQRQRLIETITDISNTRVDMALKEQEEVPGGSFRGINRSRS